MVDSINPVNNNNDNNTQNPPANTPDNSFYSGFNRPNEVHVNLVGEHRVGGQNPALPPEENIQVQQKEITQTQPITPQPNASFQPAKPIYQSVKPAATPPLTQTPQSRTEEVKAGGAPVSAYQSASAGSGGLGKGPIFVLLGGIILIIIAGVATFFVTDSINKNNLTKQNQDYSKLQSDLASLKTTPAVLELPISEPPKSDVVPPVETPKVEPSVILPTTPETTPQTPTVQSDGTQPAQG